MTSNNCTSTAPLVLIADDLPDVIRDWESALNGYGIKSVKAMSIRELCTTFFAHEHEIDAVILDGCIPGHSVNTIAFITIAREIGFTKPIIAASSLPRYRDQMVRWGCSHQAPKDTAADLAADLLSRS